jgi:SAM-dependent methyltransferase
MTRGPSCREVITIVVSDWSETDMGLRNRIFALMYDQLMARGERAGLAKTRSALLATASGDVLEIGAGTGRNLEHYPSSLGTITLTEPDPSMLHRLERVVRRFHRPVTVLRAPAEDLPFDDEAFDTVVSTLVLCGVDDQPRAVREIARVLKPGGRMLLIEHVRSDDAELARWQDRINGVNRRIIGCECNRPTRESLRHVGFGVDALVGGDLPKAPAFTRPTIVGAATRPGPTAPSTAPERLIGETG